MTIGETKDRLQAALSVLDKLAEAVGGEEVAINVTVSSTSSRVHLPVQTMRAVVAALPEIDTSLEPFRDKASGTRYWTTSIDGVDVFAVLLEGETPEGGDEE